MGREGFEPPNAEGGQIYSLVQLTTLPPARESPRLRPAGSAVVVANHFGPGKLAEGFEPTTRGLQNRCSTPELREPVRPPARTHLIVVAVPTLRSLRESLTVGWPHSRFKSNFRPDHHPISFTRPHSA